VKTPEVAILPQQTKAMPVLYESFAHEWTSTRMNLALKRRLEGFSHSQDPQPKFPFARLSDVAVAATIANRAESPTDASAKSGRSAAVSLVFE
jgi:hypothetical protein